MLTCSNCFTVSKIVTSRTAYSSYKRYNHFIVLYVMLKVILYIFFHRRMLSPIKELGFPFSDDSRSNKRIQKKTVPTPKGNRSLRSSAKETTVDSHNNERCTRSKTLEGRIDNESIKIYEDSWNRSKIRSNNIEGLVDKKTIKPVEKTIEPRRELNSTKNNKRKLRSNAIEGPAEKKTIKPVEKTFEPGREMNSTTYSTKNNRRKVRSNTYTIEDPAETKGINSTQEIVEPRRELISSLDPATSNTIEKCSNTTDYLTERKRIDSIKKILETSRPFNDAAGATVSEHTCRTETK